ncbi:MAG: hypothetical protein HC908_09410 [Calothrix sp. SM1_7_51]|nr:hypothetical protein [Calothrix sp. SM1_7_51]
MSVTSTYSLQIPGQATIEISKDDLRSLLGEIEAELHHSKVYRLALATVQKLLGESAEEAKFLFKAVGREAIGLAFKQFAQNHEKFLNSSDKNDFNSQASSAPSIEETPSFSEIDSTVASEKKGDLSEYLTNVKLNSQSTINAVDNNEENQSLSDKVAVSNTANTRVQNKVEKSSNFSPLKWFESNKKTSKAEVAKQVALEERTEAFSKIGTQLREARLARGFSLEQLNIYTHVPIHQMQAVEEANFDALPEDVFIRGFIRVMGNALGLNGMAVAATLPSPEPAKTVIPSTWYQTKGFSSGIGAQFSSIHLYVGYTALVAGAVSGLSMMSQQSTNQRLINQDAATPDSTNRVHQSNKDKEATAKPGINKTNNGISVGSDIAPPEAL